MNKIGKILLGVVAIAVVGAALFFIQGGDKKAEPGIDVSGTPCEGIAGARAAVDAEYQSRLAEADSTYRKDMEQASDDYWEAKRNLDNIKYACETEALLADPCKAHFERASALAKEILDNIDTGYDEAKSAERDQAKEDWEKCKKDPPEEDTYEGKKAKCEDEFRISELLAQDTRAQAEAGALSKYTEAFDSAENNRKSKHGQLDAIEKECNKEPTKSSVKVGRIGGDEINIQSGSPACTGKFQGFDQETQNEINRLQQLYNQANAGGKTDGLGGTNQLADKISELRGDMAVGARECVSDSDCGDIEPVCCSDAEYGRVLCADGECTNKKTECEEDEVCLGKPAECVAPGEGALSKPITLSRTITIGEPCSNRLHILNLIKKDETSDRFEISGQVPGWLGFTDVGGSLPKDVEVTIVCSSFTTPGTYTAEAAITVYDDKNNLINTIPLIVNIEVVGSVVVEEEPKIKVGDDVDPIDPEDEGATANTGDDIIIEEEPEEQVLLGPGNISFSYDHANPRCPLPVSPVTISGPAGATWNMRSSLPVWLSIPGGSSGTVPATIEMQFPCMLDKYENQQQSAVLEFQITTPGGQTVNKSTNVSGQFTNF